VPCRITCTRLAGSGALTALFRLSSGRHATGWPLLFEWHCAGGHVQAGAAVVVDEADACCSA
jgi:hypothetical protein